MRELILHDLGDAQLSGLSGDRRFATAYNAALQAANLAIACAGYRITARIGHHQLSLEAARLAIGPSSQKLLDYFDLCRRKRNVIDYISSGVATDTEAAEIVSKAAEFYDLVEQWIATNHPSLKR